MRLSREDYRSKVLGCWMGKNIGGTLGAPFEWKRQVNDVSFYTQPLTGEPLPNDDLDIQLLWLVALEERGLDLTSQTLSEYWCLYVTPHWAEYGTGKINMRSGLQPPLSGTLHNDYRHSCGAFIRSEIWACIAPGQPELAAQYALNDAILDHGSGEGTFAEVFCAALESAAFVVKDLPTLLEIGLSYIPEKCGIARAVRCAVAAHKKGMKWREARDEILREHRGKVCWWANRVSEEDEKKGFLTGQLGYDAPSNVALLVAGLLYGGDDFGQVLCVAVNCGEDTDCTAATAGSIWGIIHGIAAIPQKWIDPIGRKIKTACLNLGELGYFGGQLPQTVNEMTDRTERQAMQLLMRRPGGPMAIAADLPTDLSDVDPAKLRSPDQGAALLGSLGGPTYRFDFFTVEVDYGAGPFIRDNAPATVTVKIRNTYKVQANVSLQWYLPPNWTVSPSATGYVMSLPTWTYNPVSVPFVLQTPRVERAMNRAVLELTIEGRPTVMLVPITLQNGNFLPPATA
jgi:ADP-ribosylglycohydrolase